MKRFRIHKKLESMQLPGGISFEKYHQINCRNDFPYTVLIKQNAICKMEYQISYESIKNDSSFLECILNV